MRHSFYAQKVHDTKPCHGLFCALSSCLQHFERVSSISGTPQRVLRAFHAQHVTNFRDQVLDMAGGHVTIGNELYTTLRGLGEDAQPTREVIADLWQHDVHFPFFRDGRVVLTTTDGGADTVIETKVVIPTVVDRLQPVPIANAVEVTSKSVLLDQLEPLLVRYCVESKLPKHLWHYDFTVNQCLQVALGSTVTDLHRDQSASHVNALKFAHTREDLQRLVEFHLLSKDVLDICRDNAQSRLYNSMVAPGVVKNPRAYLAGLIAHHYASPETLPERYQALCPELEPMVKSLIK